MIWSIIPHVLRCQSCHNVATHLHKILLSFWQLFDIFLTLFCWLLIELTSITSKNYEARGRVVKHEIWQVCRFHLNWSGQTQKPWKSCQTWNKNLHACDNSPMCCCTHYFSLKLYRLIVTCIKVYLSLQSSKTCEDTNLFISYYLMANYWQTIIKKGHKDDL